MARVREHRESRMVEEEGIWRQVGSGSRLCAWANTRGIDFRLVRIWTPADGEGRKLEKRLKNRKAGPKFCPICRGGMWLEEYTMDSLQELAF